MSIYGLFWEKYGFRKEDVDKLDPKLVKKVLIYHNVEAELRDQELRKRR